MHCFDRLRHVRVNVMIKQRRHEVGLVGKKGNNKYTDCYYYFVWSLTTSFAVFQLLFPSSVSEISSVLDLRKCIGVSQLNVTGGLCHLECLLTYVHRAKESQHLECIAPHVWKVLLISSLHEKNRNP